MYRFLLAIAAFAAITTSANAQSDFPCQAFQMQPNGMLVAVQSVTLSSPGGGRVVTKPGVSFSRGTSVGGLDVYAAYQQYCR
jgi:hypothetical protein